MTVGTLERRDTGTLLAAAPVTATPVPGAATPRGLLVQLTRWNDIRAVSTRTGLSFRETWTPGSMVPAPVIDVTNGHDGPVIGRARVDTWRDNGTGPEVWLDIAPSSDGRDAMAMVDADVLRDVSVEFAEVQPGPGAELPDQLLVREQGVVHRIALVMRPSHDAPILEIRHQEDPTMSNTDTTDQGSIREHVLAGVPEGGAEQLEQRSADTPDTTTASPPAVQPLDLGEPPAELQQRSIEDAIRRQLAQLQLDQRTDTAPAAPGLQYRSLDEWAGAIYERYDPSTLQHRAIVDQVTANNPGVFANTWVQEIVGIITRSRPSIAAWGSGGLPDGQLEVDWPYYDGDVHALVAEQLAELDEVNSVLVNILKDASAMRTFAGGSRMSYQLVRKSRPSYREAYLRLMTIAYALACNKAMITDVEASNVTTGAATHVAFDWATPGASEDLREAILRASTMVEAATGSPAQFAVASTDLFIKCAGFADVFPRQYSTQNVTGEIDVTQLAVSIAGLPVRHDPAAAATSFKVSNSIAATWHEEGPFPAQAEDVHHLGSNVAVWGMGCAAIYVPNGIIAVETLQPA